MTNPDDSSRSQRTQKRKSASTRFIPFAVMMWWSPKRLATTVIGLLMTKRMAALKTVSAWVLTAALVLISGCTTSTAVVVSGLPQTSAQAPAWCSLKQLKLGTQTTYLGQADGASSRSEALELARKDALNQFASEMGVTVESSSVSSQRETNGQLFTDVQVLVRSQSAPVSIRGLKRSRRFVSEQKGGGFAACVEVSIPIEESERLRRLSLAKTALWVSCSVDKAPVPCPGAVVERIEDILTKHGIALAGRVAGDRGAALAKARVINAAHLISAAVTAMFLGEDNGEFYAEASINLQKQDSSDGKIIASISLTPQKGGHFSKEDSIHVALEEALKALAKRVRREGFGL